MKRILTCFSLFTVLGATAQNTPQPALDFLSDFKHLRDFALSTDGSEVYFTVQSPNEEIGAIVVVKLQEGLWSTPELAPFSGKYRDIEPFLSTDGLRLYFSSNRPLEDTISPPKDYDIWFVERRNTNEEWSEPENLGKPVNTDANEFYPSLAENGNIYFTSDASHLNKDDIYWSKWKGKKYETPEVLDKAINSEGYEFNAWVSPDEKTLIFTAYNRKGGFGSGDLFISTKDVNNKWGEAMNLGAEINSSAMDYCPFLDQETNTLYFTSRRSSVTPSSFDSLTEFLEATNQYENGLSRLYKVILKQ